MTGPISATGTATSGKSNALAYFTSPFDKNKSKGQASGFLAQNTPVPIVPTGNALGGNLQQGCKDIATA